MTDLTPTSAYGTVETTELSNCYRVTDLPQLTELNNGDLFLITHLKDQYGNYESQSIPFKRVIRAVKNRGFRDELSTLAQLNQQAARRSELTAYVLSSELTGVVVPGVLASAAAYTDGEIAKVHTHANLAVLSGITTTDVSQWGNDAGYLVSSDFAFTYSDRAIWLKAGAALLSVDANDFIKDGMVESAYYDTAAKEIVITFNTAAGKSPIRIYVGDLVDVYTAGDGLRLVGSEFSVDDGVVAKRSWVEGKGYLTEHQSLSEYAKKSELPTKVSQLENDSGYLTEHQSLADYAKKAEIPAKVSQLENDSGYLTEHQSLAGYATEAWVEGKGYLTAHQSLADYAKKADIPTKVSAFENDVGYLSAHQSLADYAKKTDIPTNVSQLANDAGYLSAHQSLAGYATESWVEGKGYLTEHQSLEGYAKTTDIPTKVSAFENDAGYLTEHQSLADYAKKSEIPAKVSDLENDAGYQLRTVFRDWTES